MTSKILVRAFIVLCATAILGVAVCGCDDLGEYDDVEEYYNSFDDIVLINGSTGEIDEYSIEKYFYNDSSRENFLINENNEYEGIDHGDYVYMAIPVNCNMEIDSVALYLQSVNDVSVYINIYITDYIPSQWEGKDEIETTEESSEVTYESDSEEISEGESEVTFESTSEEVFDSDSKVDSEVDSEEIAEEETDDTKKYDDPDPDTRIGEVTIHLRKENWDSFVLDEFYVDGSTQESISIEKDQYILLQFKNNSGVKHVNLQTENTPQRAYITMTNLLIRSLDINTDTETQEVNTSV